MSKNDDMFQRVNEVIKSRIKPQLAEHFGDIELKEVKDCIVRVKLLGACGSCPSAQETLEGVVLVELQKVIPEIKEVILATEVSDELIDIAKKILNKGK